jgi:hypothetical protein
MIMGYSCTAKAGLVLDAIGEIMDRAMPNEKISNKLPNGFYERGREQPDGAITGSTWKTVRIYTDAERLAAAIKTGCPNNPEWVGNPCKNGGSFKISADGKIVRFPQLTKAQKAEAEKTGAAKYAARYGALGLQSPLAY